MKYRKIPNLALVLVMIASLLVAAGGATSAAVPAPDVAVSAFEREATRQGEITAAPAPPDPAEKYQQKYQKVQEKKDKRVTPAERQAAADQRGRSRLHGNPDGLGGDAGPGTSLLQPPELCQQPAAGT